MKEMRKTIYTIVIFDNQNNDGYGTRHEFYGDADHVKKEAINYLAKFDKNETIGILYHFQHFEWQETTQVYGGINSPINLISRCAQDNRITVGEAISLLQND